MHDLTRFGQITAVLIWLTLFVDPVSAQWPQYRGPEADGTVKDSIETPDWSDGVSEVWRKPTPLGFSSFSIANGRAYTLIARDDESGQERQICVAMDADTGEEIWAHAFHENDYGRGGGGAGAPGNRGGDGPRSTPTIDGERVYVYDAQLLLACLNAESGEMVWQRDIMKDHEGRNITWANATSPVIDGDLLFVAGGGPGQSMIAFDKLTGDVVWKNGDEKLTHATPIVTELHGQKQLIFFLQFGLIAVEPSTGKEIWRTGFPYRTSTAASPVVDGNNVYCSAGYGVGAELFQVDSNMNVEQVWRKHNRLMNHWSTPVVHEGHLYGLYHFKKYGKAPLQCVELATGQIKWKKAGFGQGNCILIGDKLAVLSDAGEIAIVAATPDKYTELARSKVLAGKCWSTPAYSDGRLFVRSTQEGVCIDLK